MIINPHILDITGSTFSLTSTIYSIRNNRLTWPTSLIAIIIGIILFFNKGLYGDMSLHVVYFALAFYGWFQWQYGGKNRTQLPITHLTKKLALILGIILLSSIGLLTAFLHFYTDSKVPLWDASTTILSLTADFLMCRRIIQCWHLWFIVDGLFAALYFYKDIPMHGIMYALYVGLAVIGYLKWHKQQKTQAETLIITEAIS